MLSVNGDLRGCGELRNQHDVDVAEHGTGRARPRFETPTHYMTFGAAPDLMQATKIAVQEMVDFLVEAQSMTRTEANALTGIAANLRMSEVVDVNMGVYMTIAKKIFE